MSSTTSVDISNSVYANKLFSVSGEETIPTGLAFNSDESKVWIIGVSSDTIHQYTLSTPGDISTASYDNKSFSVRSQEPNPRSLSFNNNQSKMWVVGTTNDKIHQYTLSTPGDISTASYDSKSFSVSSEEGNPIDLAFNSNQSKVWVVGTTNDKIHQYTLSTPGDISTASYDSKSFSVSSEETIPTGLAFNSNQSKVWVVGISSDTIYQYTLSTPGDISTASYDNKSFSVRSQEPNPQGLAFNSDQSKVWVVGNTNNTIYQYSTAAPIFRISNSFTSKYSIRNQTSKSITSRYAIAGKAAKQLTSKFSIRKLVNNSKKITDISAARYDSNKSFSVRTQEESPTGLAFNSDESKVWIIGVSSDTIHQYTLSTPGDISTASYDNKSFSVNSQELQPTGLAFNNDQSKVWIIGSSSDEIYQYTLSTPGDISTASYDGSSFVVDSQELQPRDLAFNHDQSKVYVVGLSNDTIYQYTLSTPGTISTADYDNKSFSVRSQEGNPTGLTFNHDESKMWVVGINSDRIHQYTLSTPGDVSTAGYDNKSFGVSAQENTPSALAFNSDFSKVYVVGLANDTIYQYTDIKIIPDFASKYTVVGRVLKSVTSKFTIEDFIMRHFTSRYKIYNSVEKSVASRFKIVGKVKKSVTSKYQLVGRVLKSLTSRYDIKNSVRKSITSRYAIAGKAAKQLTSKFSIRKLVTNTKKTMDVSTATYDSKLKFIGNEFTAPTGVTFNKNRSKMWTVGKDNLFAYQYSLSTPGDVSTATYDNKKIGVSAGTQGISFNADYTKMYLVNSSLDTVIQYDLSTAEDISTAVQVSSYSVSSQEDGPRGIAVNRDVSKIWIVGSQRDTVYQYTLSTPGDVSTASYDNKSFGISNDAFPQGVTFNETETMMWVVGSSTDRVYQYTLGTASDISTASYDTLSYSFNGLLTNPTDVKFNDDFTVMYVTGQHNNRVYQFSIPESKVNFISKYIISSRVAKSLTSRYKILGMAAKSITSKYQITGRALKQITSRYVIEGSVKRFITSQYKITGRIAKSLTSQYEISSRVAKFLNSKYQIASKVKKSVMSRYVIEGSVKRFITSRYKIVGRITKPLTSQYKITGRVAKILNSKYQITGRALKQITSRYVIEGSVKRFITSQYKITGRIAKSLTSRYNIINMVEKSLTSKYQLISRVTKSLTSVYTVDGFVARVVTGQYRIVGRVKKSLTSKYHVRNLVTNTRKKTVDVSTAVYDNKYKSGGSEFSSPTGVIFNKNRSKMWVTGLPSTFIYQYTLSTPGDLSTATYDNKRLAVLAGTQGIVFNEDYTTLFVINSTADRITQYDLSTAEDISASTSIAIYSITEEAGPRGIAANKDLSKIWIVGSGQDEVFQYSLSTPGDLTTISYDSKSFNISSEDSFPQGVTFNETETKMWVVGSSTDSVHQYTLSTPGDVSTASYDSLSYSFSGLSTNPTDVKFNDDFTAMYITGQHNNRVYQFSIPASLTNFISKYAIVGRVVKSVTSRYVINKFVARFITAKYKIASKVIKQITSKYDISGNVISSVTSRYSIRNIARKTLTSQYKITSRITNILTSQYKIVGNVIKSITSQYRIDGTVLSTITSKYDIKNSIAKSLTSRYMILNKFSKSLTSRYSIIGKVTKSIISKFSIKNLTSKTLTSQYEISGKITKLLISRYTIFSRIAKSLTSQYSIRDTISKILNSKYSVIGRVIHIVKSKYYVGDIEIPVSGTFKMLTTVKSFKLITNKAMRDK